MSLVICPDCGKEQDNINRFCRNCGADISKVEPIPDSKEIIMDSVGEEPKEYDAGKCPTCGLKISQNQQFCPNCGSSLIGLYNDVPKREVQGISAEDEQAIATESGQVATKSEQEVITRKEPILSILLSILFPGLGQLYNGQMNKGIYFIIIAIVSLILIFFIIGLLLYPLFWLWSIFDAYSSAVKLNNGEFVEDKLF